MVFRTPVPDLSRDASRRASARRGACAQRVCLRRGRIRRRRRLDGARSDRARTSVAARAPHRGGGRVNETVVAFAIGILCASGVWLLLRPRTFQVMLGLSLISYAV